MYNNISIVSKIIFGRGCFNQLEDILNEKRLNLDAPFIFLVDDVFKGDSRLTSRIPLAYKDSIKYVSTKEEPTTIQVDEITEDIILSYSEKPSGIIGIGGGSILDIAKTVAVMLTNQGTADMYLGKNLVKNPAVYHVGIPTISGSGAEASMKAILVDNNEKSEIASEFVTFNQLILDPELTQGIPTDQWFYTSFSCYINAVESLRANNSNTMSMANAKSAIELCGQIFKNDIEEELKQEQMMVASWHSALAIAITGPGIASTLGSVICGVLGIKSALSICLVFNQLSEMYPEEVAFFKTLLEKHEILLPNEICNSLSDSEFRKLSKLSMENENAWENMLGKNWKSRISKEEITELYTLI